MLFLDLAHVDFQVYAVGGHSLSHLIRMDDLARSSDAPGISTPSFIALAIAALSGRISVLTTMYSSGISSSLLIAAISRPATQLIVNSGQLIFLMPVRSMFSRK